MRIICFVIKKQSAFPVENNMQRKYFFISVSPIMKWFAFFIAAFTKAKFKILLLVRNIAVKTCIVVKIQLFIPLQP